MKMQFYQIERVLGVKSEQSGEVSSLSIVADSRLVDWQV